MDQTSVCERVNHGHSFQLIRIELFKMQGLDPTKSTGCMLKNLLPWPSRSAISMTLNTEQVPGKTTRQSRPQSSTDSHQIGLADLHGRLILHVRYTEQVGLDNLHF